ncbi:MAG: hypothetical protein JRE64_16235 [Deltaproteobacteria bacterium]|nr:hypothetical protein [Deltaproteobacteria bacterium]
MTKIPSELKKLLYSKGRGRIGIRHLDLGLMKGRSSPISYFFATDIINLEPFHMHYWHQPSVCTGANFGFFEGKENGIRKTDGIDQDHVTDAVKKYTFRWFDQSYSNLIMEEVELKLKKTWGPGDYHLLVRNCQHFMQEAIKSYNSILQEKIKEYHRSLRHFRRTFGGAA